jgi:hypothetical protein
LHINQRRAVSGCINVTANVGVTNHCLNLQSPSTVNITVWFVINFPHYTTI